MFIFVYDILIGKINNEIILAKKEMQYDVLKNKVDEIDEKRY